VKVIGPRATVVCRVVADDTVLRGTAWCRSTSRAPTSVS
jgi:hypothetical protein